MLKIAITGGVATGKTTLLKILASLGERVFSCDVMVAQLYEEEEIKAKLARIFGADILDKEGKVKKEVILQRISQDAGLKKSLENLLHPLVLCKLQNLFKEYEKQGTKVVFVEVPLLFEVGWEKYFDEIWLTMCEEETLKKRLEMRGTPQHLLFLNHQLPLSEKQKRAHRIFFTEKDLPTLEEEVKKALKELYQHLEE